MSDGQATPSIEKFTIPTSRMSAEAVNTWVQAAAPPVGLVVPKATPSPPPTHSAGEEQAI